MSDLKKFTLDIRGGATLTKDILGFIGRRVTWKQEWHEIGGKRNFYRSRWEVKYANYLEILKRAGEIEEWEHEPKSFYFENEKRGAVCYIPDFRVTRKDGTHYWIEVKGYMDSRSKTKLKRFAKHFPEEEMLVVGKEWFKNNR